MTRQLLPLAAAIFATTAASMAAEVGPNHGAPGFTVEILVDGRPLAQYPARGVRYVEASKGHEYGIRLTNPLPVRVAVALSVDGLNTIDARRTDARTARKWVLDPHETVIINGWQTSQSEARRFVFTTEERSYAERLGRADNLGIISAVLFRERVARPVPALMTPLAGAPSRDQARAGAPPQSPPAAEAGSGSARDNKREGRLGEAASAEAASAQKALTRADEYAATGIGRSTEHLVHQVYLDLEEVPAASYDIRYEYRAQLVRLGVLPRAWGQPEPLDRREGARGFSPGFCPIPR